MSVARDVTKLPKWAQTRIDTLERNNAYLKAVLAEGPEDSDTFADPYSDSPRPLGKRTMIRFDVGDSSREHFDVRLEGDVLEVYGGSALMLRPHAANVVKLKIER